MECNRSIFWNLFL